MLLFNWNGLMWFATKNEIKKLSGHTIKENVINPAITCSKLAIETPEQGVKYVQS